MLRLYYHPFSSFCQKALIALYEKNVAFEGEIINFAEPGHRERLEEVWGLAKFPVLRDEDRDVTVPEATLIIEYLDNELEALPRLVPEAPDEARRVRLLDRLFDNYVSTPLTKIVVDNFRPEGGSDKIGVEEARALIEKSYGVLERELAEDGWATGDAFTLADCAAAPALFYANTAVPFGEHRKVAAYYQRLLHRPSFARAVEEARPYRHFFPLPWPADYD